MKERWRPVHGYSGLYEVSDQGRVRRLPRRGLDDRLLRGKMLSVKGTGPGGRPRVCLYKNGRRTWYLVYRLVLEAFVGPCPRGMESRHYRNPSVTDCRLSNLRWGTHRENVSDMIKHGNYRRVRRPNGTFARHAKRN